jgi:hypothetical protein
MLNLADRITASGRLAASIMSGELNLGWEKSKMDCNRYLACAVLFLGVQFTATALGQSGFDIESVDDDSAARLACTEVSKDGRQVVGVCSDQLPGNSAFAPGAAIPYGATPDWSNSQRRQVGSVQIADMNGDGRVDLIVGCYSSSSFPPYDDWHNFIHYNTGTALEALPSWISADQVSTGDLQVGLINNDAYPDIFSANGGGSMAPSVIYFGGPTGPSTSPGWSSVVPGNTWATSATLFDIDHDGDLDVTTTNQGAVQGDSFRPIFLYRNNAGVLESTPSWQSAEISIQNTTAYADYDGDGWEDMAVSKWANFQTGIYKNVAGTPQANSIWTTGATTTDRGVAWADVDNNGWPDLALGKNPTQLWSNNAGVLAVTWTATAPFFGHQELRFYDVDRDGDQDLAEIHFGDGRTHIYLNNNGVLSSTPSWTYDNTVVGNTFAFGDINGDCMPDIAIGYSGDVSLLVFYNRICRLDVTRDGEVNIDDLLGVINAWGSPSVLHDIAPGCGDGNVDIDDLLAVINAWGPCP